VRGGFEACDNLLGMREAFCLLGVSDGSEEARLCLSESDCSASIGVGGVTKVLGPSEVDGGVFAMTRGFVFLGDGVDTVGP